MTIKDYLAVLCVELLVLPISNSHLKPNRYHLSRTKETHRKERLNEC
jgi:hypothetical protein